MWLEVRYFSGGPVPGTKSPNPPALGSPGRKSHPFQGQSCWSPWQHNHLLHAAMGKEVKSELQQQYVSNPINVLFHYLITEMVSHCSCRLGKTDRPESGFCQTPNNTRDWVLMNGSSILLDKAGSFQDWIQYTGKFLLTSPLTRNWLSQFCVTFSSSLAPFSLPENKTVRSAQTLLFAYETCVKLQHKNLGTSQLCRVFPSSSF